MEKLHSWSSSKIVGHMLPLSPGSIAYVEWMYHPLHVRIVRIIALCSDPKHPS